MVRKEVIVINKLGLHARAAAKFVTTASSFVANIQLSRNGRTVNGKSIMGVMMLAAAKGTSLEVIAIGEDEEYAVNALAQLVAGRFGELE